MAIADNLYYKIKPEEKTYFEDVIEKKLMISQVINRNNIENLTKWFIQLKKN